MKQKITGFEKDEEDHWRAILESESYSSAKSVTKNPLYDKPQELHLTSSR